MYLRNSYIYISESVKNQKKEKTKKNSIFFEKTLDKEFKLGYNSRPTTQRPKRKG